MADTLREQRREGDREGAKETLKSAQTTESYQTDKTLHQIAREVPIDRVRQINTPPERIDDPEKWDMIDISHRIPREFRKSIDAEGLMLANEFSESPERISDPDGLSSWDYKYSEKYREREHLLMELRSNPRWREERGDIEKLFDDLTSGRFFDPHNLNHSVLGYPSSDEAYKRLYESFDRHSLIDPTEGSIWFSAYGSPWAKLTRQLVIISSRNPDARHFFKRVLVDSNSDIYAPIGMFSAFMKAESLPRNGRYQDMRFLVNSEYEDKYRKQNGHIDDGFSWMDIADCIVDLKAGRMWVRKYSEVEKKEVEEDIEAYRSGKKHL